MLFEINKYVCIRFDCQRVRVHYHKLYDKFNFISLNDEVLKSHSEYDVKVMIN